MTPLTLALELGPRSYDIIIGSGLLAECGPRLRPLVSGKQAAVVTNTTVAPLYLATVLESLRSSGFDPIPVILPDGEAFKDWQTLQQIFDPLIAAKFERSALLIALGGGVIGDMVGFAASALLRGVAFAQIPTTLLSQVDSSVGGKTGINHPLGKNLIGAFYQPKRVLIDLESLTSLPRRELLSGLAEVVKYGVVYDAAFFAFLERHLEAILRLDREILGTVIHTCCTLKAKVVAADEREGGVRALLNMGHTFGHAIEHLAGYGTILHGEAVAIGMVMAVDLSHRLGLATALDVERLRALLARAGLPIQAPSFPAAAFIDTMGRDKKVEQGAIRFVLCQGLGHGLIQANVPLELITQAIEANLDQP